MPFFYIAQESPPAQRQEQVCLIDYLADFAIKTPDHAVDFRVMESAKAMFNVLCPAVTIELMLTSQRPFLFGKTVISKPAAVLRQRLHDLHGERFSFALVGVEAYEYRCARPDQWRRTGNAAP